MNNIKVVIFEDNTNLRRGLTTLINGSDGFECAGAFGNCDNLIKNILDTKPDVVLMDIEMPGMDGLELCKQLRRLPGYQKTPVIYVTSHSDFESRARSALSGGDDLIGKPVFALELAVKAMAHLLISQMDGARGSDQQI